MTPGGPATEKGEILKLCPVLVPHFADLRRLNSSNLQAPFYLPNGLPEFACKASVVTILGWHLTWRDNPVVRQLARGFHLCS